MPDEQEKKPTRLILCTVLVETNATDEELNEIAKEGPGKVIDDEGTIVKAVKWVNVNSLEETHLQDLFERFKDSADSITERDVREA